MTSPSSALPSALSLIGGTPLVHLARLWPGPGRLLAKVESGQPGGSVKDRIALAIVEDALAEGELTQGQPVVEMTSGNTGAGLAVVCGVLGHPFTAVMPRGNSPERVFMLQALGARVVLVDQVDGLPGQVTGADIQRATLEARTLADQEGAFYVDQFHRPGSVRAHLEGTGPEIWEQTHGLVDAFVAAVGSAGTFVGISRYLKYHKPDVHCAAVEPASCRVLAGEAVTNPRHVIQGTGYGLIPPHWDPDLADELLSVTDEEATRWRSRLAAEEGLHAGFSAGANVAASIQLLQTRGARCLVTILCDSGLKYGGA